jgi:ATP-binding cassette, subfamily B, bacterial
VYSHTRPVPSPVPESDRSAPSSAERPGSLPSPDAALEATPAGAARPLGSGSAIAGRALLLRALTDQRLGLALGVGSGLAWSAGKVIVPLLVKQAIDQGIGSGSSGAAVSWAFGIGGAGLIAALFTGLRRYFAFLQGRRTERELRERMFEHILRLPFAFHDRTQTGELMSRSNADLQQIQNLITMVPLTLSNVLTVLAATVILVSIHPLLALLALGPLPVINVLGRKFSERLHPAVRGLQEETAQLASVVEESVAGVRVVKGFGAEPTQRARLVEEADDVYGIAMQAARVRSRYLPAIELIPGLGLVFVLGYGGHEVLAGRLSIGTFVMFNAYVALLVNPLRQLGQIIAQIQRARASAERVAAVLNVTPGIVDPVDPRTLPRPGAVQGEVRFEGVRFGYPGERGRKVLEKLDLVLHAGECVALVGETGSGKSTIAKLIPRLYDVDKGRVLLDGVDVRELRLRELRAAIGIVFEDTFLFSDSVAANIAFGRPSAPPDEVERAARLAGAHDFIVQLPAGYATPIGERGFSLSGGQRQRIAIARAILADPRVLILDDATSSVDPEKEQEIRDAMSEVMRGRTTLVIAHRPATIALADRVLLVDRGRIAAEGKHAELLENHPRYRQVLAARDALYRSAAT